MSSPSPTPTPTPVTATVSTNGWDTVFATTYATINARITAQWQALITKAPALGEIDAQLNDGPVKVSTQLTMSAWQLTQGGSGNLIRMLLPISSGSMTGITQSWPLAGQSIEIQLALKWVPQQNQIQFSINNNVSAIETDLGTANTTVTANIVQAFATGGVTLSDTATVAIITPSVCWKISDPSSNMSFYVYVTNAGGASSLIEVYQYVPNSLVLHPTSTITPVTVISAGNISDEVDGSFFKTMVSQNIDENLKQFNFVFAAVDVVTQLAEADIWSWLQPTSVEYAVVEPLENPANDNCIFGILSMVGNHTNADPVLQVDAHAVPTGCSHGLLISPSMFLHNILFTGVSSVFQESSPSDFTIDKQNLSITNAKPLTWGQCKLNDGSIVTLAVDAGNFTLGVENDRINLSFTNLNYPVYIDGINVGQVDIIYSGQFQLALNKGTNGNQTLWFDIPADQKNINSVSTVMNQTYFTIEEVTGIIAGVLTMFGLVGGLASAMAKDAAESALIAAGEVRAGASSQEFKQAFDQLLRNPPARRAFIGDAGFAALNLLNHAVFELGEASFWASAAKWCGVIALLTGGVGVYFDAKKILLEKAAQNDWDNTPSFTNFADKSVSQYSFGSLSTLKVQSVGLADAMQIGFTSS